MSPFPPPRCASARDADEGRAEWRSRFQNVNRSEGGQSHFAAQDWDSPRCCRDDPINVQPNVRGLIYSRTWSAGARYAS